MGCLLRVISLKRSHKPRLSAHHPGRVSFHQRKEQASFVLRSVLFPTLEHTSSQQIADLPGILRQQGESSRLNLLSPSRDRISFTGHAEHQQMRKNGGILPMVWSEPWSARRRPTFCAARKRTAARTERNTRKTSHVARQSILWPETAAWAHCTPQARLGGAATAGKISRAACNQG